MSFLSSLLSKKDGLTLKIPDVNLYPEDPFYTSLIGKSLRWAVAAGRHIVIFTELIVIGSFLSRFVLDRQLSDLNREILQKQSIVESYGTLESDVRLLQKRTKDINGILDQQGKYRALESLTKVTPPDVVFEQISLANDRFSLKGHTLSSNSLSILVEGLKNDPQMSTVSINDIESGDNRDPGIQFNLTVEYKAVGDAAAEPTAGAPGGNL